MTINLTTQLRKHWLPIILVAVILVLLANNLPSPYTNFPNTNNYAISEAMIDPDEVRLAGSKVGMNTPQYSDPAPTIAENRLTILSSSLSLLVDSVSQTIESIQTLAEQNGGYLVNSNLHEPEGVAVGDITIRIPVEKRDLVITQLKNLGIRVVDEHTSGRDVTDQYTDIDAHLTTLRTTQAKFTALLDSATTVQDSLAIQRELINLQRQIDSYIGQQKYLTGNAELSLITISLATDELALPYAPDKPWRPQVVFRTAVRSILNLGRSIVSLTIWLAVYSPIWLLAFGLYYWLIKHKT